MTGNGLWTSDGINPALIVADHAVIGPNAGSNNQVVLNFWDYPTTSFTATVIFTAPATYADLTSVQIAFLNSPDNLITWFPTAPDALTLSFLVQDDTHDVAITPGTQHTIVMAYNAGTQHYVVTIDGVQIADIVRVVAAAVGDAGLFLALYSTGATTQVINSIRITSP